MKYEELEKFNKSRKIERIHQNIIEDEIDELDNEIIKVDWKSLGIRNIFVALKRLR